MFFVIDSVFLRSSAKVSQITKDAGHYAALTGNPPAITSNAAHMPPPATNMGDAAGDTVMQTDEVVESISPALTQDNPPPAYARDRRDFTNFLAHSARASTSSKQGLSPATITKLFKQAKSEYGLKKQSAVAPDLSLKRARTGNSQENLYPSENDLPWETPKKFAKSASPLPTNERQSFQDGNRFNSLVNVPQNVTFEHPPGPSDKNRRQPNQARAKHAGEARRASANKPPPPQDDVNDPTASQASATTAPTSAPRRNRPPPLYITGISVKDLIAILLEQLKKNEFFIRQTDADNLSLFIFGMDNYTTAKKCLAEKNIQFYTFTPKSEKPKNVVLKGINGNYSADEVKSELTSLELPEVKVSKVTKITSNNLGINTSFFIVQLTAESNKLALTREKYILHQKVRWEKLRKQEVHRCTNCQGLGHSGSNCALAHRCCRCKETHAKGECKVPAGTTDRKSLYCVNCEEFGHAASYRGCPLLKLAGYCKVFNNTQHRSARQARLGQITDQFQPGSTRAPTTSRPPECAWGEVNTGRHLFPGPSPDNSNISSMLAESESRIIKALQDQLSNMMKIVNNNASRIDFLFKQAGFHDGSP